jgi:hypothetical protein
MIVGFTPMKFEERIHPLPSRATHAAKRNSPCFSGAVSTDRMIPVGG